MDTSVVKELFDLARSYAELGALLVFIGLVIEVAAVVVFSKNKSRKEVWIEFAATILIAYGVWSEWVYGRRASDAADRLQQISDQNVAQAQGDAANARKDAANSIKAATEANLLAKKYEGSIAGTNKLAADAKRTAEGERLARVKIEELLADRKLSDAQLSTIAGKLKAFRGQEFSLIGQLGNPREPFALAQRIYKALTLADWAWLGPPKSFLFAGIEGIYVTVQPDVADPTEKAAEALVAALLAEGLKAELKRDKSADTTNAQIIISVGNKS